MTSGTLDAIRERMKSMQLASSVGNLEPESRSAATNMFVVNQESGYSEQVIPEHQYHRPSDEPIVENPGRGGGVLPLDEKALSGLQARMERLKSGSLDSL